MAVSAPKARVESVTNGHFHFSANAAACFCGAPSRLIFEPSSFRLRRKLTFHAIRYDCPFRSVRRETAVSAPKARVESLTLVSSLLPFDPRGFLLRVLSDEPGIPRSSPKRRYGTFAGVRFLRMAARERRSRYDTACDGVGHRRKVGRRISCVCLKTPTIKRKPRPGFSFFTRFACRRTRRP